MNINVKFKEHIRWSTITIGVDSLKSCIATLSNNMKTPERQSLCSGLKKQLIISDYYITETNRGTKPYVIGVEPDSETTCKFYLYEIKYDVNRNIVYLFNTKAWEYMPHMGSKKSGWQVINLEDIMRYIDVVVSDASVYDVVYAEN